MQRKSKLLLFAGVVALGTSATAVMAADHVDAPSATADPAGDIADFFAWSDGDSVIAAVTFGGLGEAGLPATYDRGVLYGVHFDRDGDGLSDHDIWARFGQDSDGNWGIQVVGMAGADPVVGAVETEIDAGLGQRVFAGLRDDPFFFDSEGLGDTLASGTLSFDASRDFFAGTNVTAIVIEVSRDLVAGGDAPFKTWATSRRAE